MTTTTADTTNPSLPARLWFGWVLAANALVLLVLWVPAMLDLTRSHTVRTFRRWAYPWSRAALALAGVRVEASAAPAAERPSGPVVYVANHQAMLDIPVLVVGLRVPFLFVARAGLAKLPLVGPVLEASVCVFLDRSAPGGSDEALDEAEQRIALGESVLFFPEGTRRADGRPACGVPHLGPFYAGAFRLAQRAGVPVVPVALGDTPALTDERTRTARPGSVALRVGAPIAADAAPTPEALADQARASMARLLRDV